MSVIRQRKKNIIVAGIIGALIVSIPLLILTLHTDRKYRQDHEALSKLLMQKKEETTKEIYVLNREMKEGEVLEKKDILVMKATGEFAESVNSSGENMVGKRCRMDLKKGTVLQEVFCQAGEAISADIRVDTYSDISFPSSITAGQFIDIRIRFLNGEDYIVVSHKKVKDVTQEQLDTAQEKNISLQLTEEEILRISSALVDQKTYKETEVYAIAYLDELQEESTITYPVNPQVFSLLHWDPNIIGRMRTIKEKEKREQLDLNLKVFLDNMTQKENVMSPEVAGKEFGEGETGEKETDVLEEIQFFE